VKQYQHHLALLEFQLEIPPCPDDDILGLNMSSKVGDDIVDITPSSSFFTRAFKYWGQEGLGTQAHSLVLTTSIQSIKTINEKSILSEMTIKSIIRFPTYFSSVLSIKSCARTGEKLEISKHMFTVWSCIYTNIMWIKFRTFFTTYCWISHY
jgi:hypothetical protein